MSKTLLKIITPNGLFWNKEIDIVTVKTTEGYLGLQHGKSPLVASVDISELIINKKGSKDYMECAIAGGLLYATPDKVKIITDAIEEKSKIDINRAEKASKKAENNIKKAASAERHMSELALKRALNRIHVRRG